MCNPFILYVSSRFPPKDMQSKAHALLPHLSYNLGRIITYTSLGVFCGIVGKISDDIMQFQGVAALAAGAFLFIYGFLGLTGKNVLKKIESATFTRYFTEGIKTIQPKSPFVVGIALGFLPCGLVYGALAGALALSHPLAGGLAMAQFGLGTGVAMLSASFFSNFLVEKRGFLKKLSMFFLMGMGGYFMLRVFW